MIMSVLFGKLKKYHKEIEMELVIKASDPLLLDNISFCIPKTNLVFLCQSNFFFQNNLGNFFSVMQDIIKIKHNLYEFDSWYCGKYCNEVWD